MSAEQRGQAFIKKAIVLHENKYDYSKVIYVKNSEKVIITCPKHGDFLQRPNDHTHKNKNGCPLCGRESSKRIRSSDNEVFISKSKLIHGDKYDYSKVKYSTALTKVEIKCDIHGIFFMKPSVHLKGSGCKLCGYSKNGYNLSKKSENFLKEALIKHGDKFEYDLLDYKNIKSKISITCKKHNLKYLQAADSHLSSNGGCKKCKSDSIKNILISNGPSFIDKANMKHGSYYSYEKVEYTGNKDRVIITCPVHGDFTQRPNDHLSGSGCVKCSVNERCYYNIPYAERNKELLQSIEGILYILYLENSKKERFLKIGISKEVDKRVLKIIKESGFILTDKKFFELSLYDAIVLEQDLMRSLKPYRYITDVAFPGYSELFVPIIENTVLKKIDNYLKLI